MAELKPCPFCGCDMKIETVTIDYIELVGNPRHKDGCMMGAMAAPRSKDVDKLVDFWNRRAKMAEYIERETLLRDLGEEPPAWCDTESEMQERSDWQRFKSIIEAQSAADVVPVVHGRWRTSVLNGYVYTFVCSECGYADVYPFDSRHRYCPNCGAKMDGADAHGLSIAEAAERNSEVR